MRSPFAISGGGLRIGDCAGAFGTIIGSWFFAASVLAHTREELSGRRETWRCTSLSEQHDNGDHQRRSQVGDERLSVDNKGDSPAMSVVVITPDDFALIKRTVEHLQAQTVCHRLELLIVAPSTGPLQDYVTQSVDFCRVRIVEVEEVESTAQANAAGVRAATAPVVAFVEGHVYPEPSWAEALIAAHEEAWAVVGPVVRNANPESALSWMDLIVGYTPWLEFASAGSVEHLPAHNSSYKRAVLLEYDHELEAALASESVLHWDMRRIGYELYLEPAARIAHLNTSRPVSLARQMFCSGRVFAATRAGEWSRPRRLLYAGGAPLIPAVRFPRILPQLLKARRQCDVPLGIAPLILLALGVSAMGELMGYALGEGDAQRRMRDMDFHRKQHVREQDISLLADVEPCQPAQCPKTGSTPDSRRNDP